MENFAKRLAIDHKIMDKSSKSSFPLKYVNEDFEVIEHAYELLTESVTKKVPIPPSGEWLLDNFYLIEEQVSSLKNSLKLSKYKKLPSVQGVARIYILARELISFADGMITKENIELFINSYETKKALLEEELFEFPAMLQVALIEHIRNVSSKIITEQLQKFKVESLVERLIKNKEITAQKFHQYKNVNLDNEAASYVEYLIYLLKKMGDNGKPYLDVLEDEISKVGTTSDEIIKSEHYAIAVQRVSMSNSILSIKNVSRLNWNLIFQNLSYIEKILSQDDGYTCLDFNTKEMYQNEIRKLAKKASVSEIYIANMLLEYARNQKVDISEILLGEEKGEFLEEIGCAQKVNIKKFFKKYKLLFYLSAIYLPTIILSILISPSFFVVLLIPISEAMVTLVNRVISRTVKPRLLPRLEKLSPDVNTFVIVPTLLNSKERVKKMMESLEVYYLSNKMDHLLFCLLGDASEEDIEVVPHDEEVMQTGREEAKKLNQKYQTNIFHFIYRKRIYNSSQEKWLGYERKRGMICEFNHFLLRGEERNISCEYNKRNISKSSSY